MPLTPNSINAIGPIQQAEAIKAAPIEVIDVMTVLKIFFLPLVYLLFGAKPDYPTTSNKL